ncbi:ISAs1 family transposase [Paludisphaera mucosa]|uniref:ISAs1 family transposase n=1 Tax=Paludisphaera mucosa TaxID=3030827 RepID=A0ABT6FF17_9BACT|nr:ISAs1 family transposase [Paludisphaera mucosa]MDG3005966.1 ISAs1 family transposase [Paludisphaera mucosa]MDG3006122.1 ISAs1 family transposase [Paludisphaera mucosa]
MSQPSPESDLDSPSIRLQDHFASLTDPRRRKVTYPLANIVTIAVCAVICGADDFVAIATWGRLKRDWLATILDLSAGIPSHDRFNAIFQVLDPGAFEKCLLSWISELHEATAGQVVAIDGKTLRGSFDRASGKSAIHMVSAWATANRLSLGQVVVEEKSNEIPAIPALLKLLELKGCLVTIDAMGCQTAIAEAVLAREADYVLAVKDNQPTLRRAIEDFFTSQMEDDFAKVEVGRFETRETAHGRVEHRAYYICDAPADLADRERWKGLAAIGVAINISTRDGRSSDAVRYYILSRRPDARAFADAVRGHWTIENSLHWQLDVTFGEDACRVRTGLADANLSVVRRAALGLLKNEKSEKIGVKNKRLAAACNTRYMEKVLAGS